MKKLIVSLILISSLLFAFAPATPTDGWWGNPEIMGLYEIVTYQMYFNTSLKYLLEFSGYSWIPVGRCYFSLLRWDGSHWVNSGLSGNLSVGEILVESGERPELRCIGGGGVMFMRAYSDSLIAPKVRIPNPVWPMTTTPLLLNWGPVP